MASPPKLEIGSPQPLQEKTGVNGGERTPTDAVDVYKPRGIGFPQPHNEREGGEGGEGGVGALTESWWGERTRAGNRPWHNSPKRRKTIPPDQEVAYERTKAAMKKFAASFLRNSRDVSIEALGIAATVGGLVPVPGFAEAVRVLLSIWQAVQLVETNRLSCLRLNERAATILYSVYVEIDIAGPSVAETLSDPLAKLTETFRRIESFVQKQVSRPFLKRYLRRHEDARRIALCHADLTDGVGLFGLAIQIRALREIQAQGGARHALPLPLPLPLPPPPGPQDVLEAIAAIRAAEAAHDRALDVADLYASMRQALRVGSDVAMLDMLQVNKGEIQEAIKTLQRALEDPRLTAPPPTAPVWQQQEQLSGEVATTPSTGSSSSRGSYPFEGALTAVPPPIAANPEQDAVFHREFLESGLDALRRLSGTGGGDSLPAWTITRWEIDREGKIGVGFFSDVYKGTWRGQQVAIKILAPTAPRQVFRHETAIWTSLRHRHVLRLLGASSATGDPPWFFVSPYMKNGTLVAFMKAHAAGGVANPDLTKAYPGPLQLMHEVAVGMAYLHRKGILHGDLKASNVLIDDELHCVISDFGQSELRSEVYRLSHRQPHGTLRWQAPEIMSGESVLTPEADVYAFAVVCIEILTAGEIPWPLLDDQTVQRLVLHENKRPRIPVQPETSLALVALIEACWSTEPLARPLFDSVARGLGHLVGSTTRVAGTAALLAGSAVARVQEADEGTRRTRSPDMAPVEELLPPPQPAPVVVDEGGNDSTAAVIPVQHVIDAARAEEATPRPPPLALQHEDHFGAGALGLKGVSMPPASGPAKRRASTSSLFVATPEGSDTTDTTDTREMDMHEVPWDGYESPPPRDAHIAARRDERRYRLLLQHDFHPTLNLPLWEPSPVQLGAVGFLSKPRGRFVTFFNALNPARTADRRVLSLPSIYGYGPVREATARQDRRNFAQIGFDLIQGLLTFKKSGGSSTFSRVVRKRYSFPLRAGHKHAYLCTENTTYHYMVDMDAAKAWFKANVREIVRIYGKEHSVQREDIFLVIGTLETHDYGLFVSHEHPDGQVHFNIYADRREGQDWGSFSTDTDLSSTVLGPGPDLHPTTTPSPASVNASKISRVHLGPETPPHAVLLARLRVKPDEDEPTRL